MYAMVPTFRHFAVESGLLLFFCVILLWQRRKWYAGFQSRPHTTDAHGGTELNTKSPGDTNRDQKRLREGKSKFNTSSVPWGDICLEGSPLAGVLGSGITSGQLADMVKRRDEQKGTAHSNKHQSRYSETPKPRNRVHTRWSPNTDSDSIFIEMDVTEINHNSNSYGIWRRRVLRFVGQ